MRFLPECSAALIVAAESAGFATKNLPIGIDRPGVAPSAHVVPDEFFCAEGTKTFSSPAESTYRYGASRVTRLVVSVVYGPQTLGCAGKHWAGAPSTPEKTWFQTPFDQLPTELLRVTHCCWDPLTIVSSNRESAMKPPLANDGPVQ